jgi:hypothetical protein
MRIKINDIEVENFNNINEGNFSVEYEPFWPFNIKFELSNKTYKDTTLDQDGNVIIDKHIFLKEIWLDNVAVSKQFLTNKIFLKTESGDQVKSQYWGFNGDCTIEFAGPDSFEWHLRSVIV